jgi:putative ATP-dependent endonuclease of OLD family
MLGVSIGGSVRISRIHIENFRALHDFELQPEDGLNLIVGENNAGKSALLAALALVLGRGNPSFEVEDFYVTDLSATGESLPSIIIDIEIRPEVGQNLSTNFSADFVDEISFDAEGSPLLRFRAQARFDAAEDRIVTEYFAVRTDDAPLPMSSSKRFRLRSYVPFYLVDAFRDTIRDIQSRRGFWGSIVNSISLDATTVSSIESEIGAINQSIISAAPRISEIEARLREIGDAIPTVDPPEDVVIEPITIDPSRILRNLDVILRTASSPRGFPLARHGEGTRSVAHLAIFRAFIDLMAQDENDNVESTPILGIEEPEVHLHPHAVRAVGTMLAKPPRQMFLTTHSPELAQSVKLTSIQILRRSVNGTERRAVPMFSTDGTSPLLDQKDQTKIERAFRGGAAEILFSRTTVLCEGPSEVQAYSYFASALGIDMDRNGISLIAVDGSYFYHLLRIMAEDALRIPWVVSADGDTLPRLANQLVQLGKATRADVDNASASGTLETSILRPHDVFTLPNGYNIEEALIYGGAALEYEQCIVNHVAPTALHDFVARENMTGHTLEEQVAAYMRSDSRTGGKKWKVLFADIVADQITDQGSDGSRIPGAIADALKLANGFAQGVATKAF